MTKSLSKRNSVDRAPPSSRLPKPSVINSALYEACRRDFRALIQHFFPLLNGGKELKPNWHIDALAYALEQVRLGKETRLMVNLPPRYLKSFITSVLWPAFILGHDPTKRLIVVCCTAELAVKFANDFRIVMNSAAYKRMFPLTRISRMKNTEHEVTTTQGGFRLTASIEAVPVGRGADFIIVDDPLTPLDALSDTKRERVNEAYRNSIPTRLDEKQTGAIVIVMQRQHVSDLCGFVLKTGDKWIVLSLPAIAIEDENIQIGDGQYHQRRAGELLHPEPEPQDVLDWTRSEIGADAFAAQYQQQPVPPGGVMINRDWIKRFEWLPIRTAGSYILQSYDTAQSSDAGSSFSVCVTFLVQEHKFYIIDVLRGRFDYPTLKSKAIRHSQKHNPSRILIEDTGVGSALVADLKATGFSAVGIKPQGDKVARMSIHSTKVENGQVLLPKDEPWLPDLEAELFAFPNGSHDDQVDAISQALANATDETYMWTDKANENFSKFVSALSFPYYLRR